MADITTHLQACATLSSLAPKQFVALADHCRLQILARGTSVYRALDEPCNVYLLVSGRVHISHVNEDGKQSILMLVQPGQLFGELAICDRRPREEYCETTEDSTVVVIPTGDLSQLIRENADLSFDMLNLFGSRQRVIKRRLSSVLFRSKRQRLFHLLKELAEDFGRPDADGVRIDLPLSHQQLGRLIGATRETVTIVLGELRTEGLVRVHRRQIIVARPDHHR